MGRFNANQIGRLRDKVANDEPLTKEELLGVLDGHESAVAELFRLREQRAADDERARVERGKRLRAALTSTERGQRLFRDNVWYRAAVPALQWGEQEGCFAEVLGIVLGPLTEELQKRVEREVQSSADTPARELWTMRLDDTLRSAVLARAPNVLGMLDLDPAVEESADQVLARVDLEEFDSAVDARHVLLDAVLAANQIGLHASHLFVGSASAAKDWFGIPRVLRLPKFEGTEYQNLFGLRLLEVPSLPEDVLVLLASEVVDPSRSELVRGYRITM